ncbi:AraC family transcriptional regulator [Oricola sp.]|uniref:AraC family transcriptional regulator n=1 Tax=Oricola sp. TaxID=1979950 RepID=UPI0025D9FB89|nr:AraC family transcriptional regulator [Oricola sp.]MCI5076346.1 AraC family transcriptional regulator [Oricola sp.]
METQIDLSRLTDLCGRHFNGISGEAKDLPPGLSVLRRQAPSDIEAAIYEPVVCLILQGSKVTSIGDQTVSLRRGDALLVSHDLPVVSRIIEASADVPYLAVVLSLDLSLVRSLYEQVADAPVPETRRRSLSKGRAEESWLEPLIRYFELMDNPLDARVLGPSIRREIHYRLLVSSIGTMLRDLLVADSHASRVAKAIRKVRAEFRSPLSVTDLARTAGMSASSFHEHFRTVTGTTPLQYQKDLRLIEAKALLVDRSRTVSQVAFAVGYESPTHFSRDYSRKFGLPPSRQATPLTASNPA